MNEYLSKTGTKYLNEMTFEISSLVAEIMNHDIQQYVSAISGITKERLDEIAGNAVPAASEFVALCDAVIYLSRKIKNKKLADVAEATERIRQRWMDGRFRQTVNAANIADALVEASDKDSQDDFLCSYHFFLDASSLCNEQMPVFLDKLLPVLRSYENPVHITVPQAVVDCLNELSADAEQAELSRANDGLMQLKKIKEAGLLSIRGDEGDSTLMSTFVSAFSRFKPVYRMALITQDEILANAVNLINATGVEGSNILVARLQEDGVLSMWFTDDEQNHSEEDDEVNDIEHDYGEEDDEVTDNEQDYSEEDDEDSDDENVISEDDLEKIMSISNLLPAEEERADEERSFGLMEEEPDDLELLEEDHLVSSSSIEPEYDGAYEEETEDFAGESEQTESDNENSSLADEQDPGSWRTLE